MGKYLKNPILVGILLTGLNPHFLTWWISIGMVILVKVIELGLLNGFLIAMFGHVWLDFLWLSTLAYLSHKGLKVFGKKYGIVLQIMAIILASFGITLVVKLMF